MSIDEAEEKLQQLMEDLRTNPPTLETEQDTRFQIIDRILTEVLGWDRSCIKTEPHTESGFIDYLLTNSGRNRFIVEAKRAPTPLIDTRNDRLNYYKANGPALKSASDGLQQAKRYCSDTGVLFAALTSGYQWLAYWAIRNDGKAPGEGKAIAFPNLDSIQDNFAIFYDLFSCEGILEERYQIHIHQAEGLSVQHIESLIPILDPSEIQLRRKTDLSSDLQTIYRGFFGSMSGDDDPEMLAKCFVESKESREADVSLTKITQNLISQVKVVNSPDATELKRQIEAAIETRRGEFVLIIGSKGAGKTTFIDRFFRLILDKPLRDNCLILRIDLADSHGDHERITPWLVARLKDELEKNLFKGAIPTYEQLQGIFMRDYDRWRHGEHKYLYQRDKQAFKEKFGQWIADLVNDDPYTYVKELLRNAVAARSLMPCIIFDNTDHFPQSFQECVFQFAQSIHRSVFSFIICPITDRTIWQLSKSGPFQSYETRAFYLPVPSTKEVLSKRISYLKEKTEDQDRNSTAEYFLNKGIRLTIGDIRAFAACVEEIFVNEEYIGRMVGWLANHDIRRSLNIAQRIITSPILSIEDLVKAYLVGDSLSLSSRRIKQALLCGDYTYFCQDDSHYVLNLFEVNPEGVTSPLTRLSILRILLDKDAGTTAPDKSYITVDDVINYFEPARLSRTILKEHLSVLLAYRLIEPYDPTENHVYEDQRIRITHSGRIHYEFCFERGEAGYMGQIAWTTPMRDFAAVDRIRDLRRRGKLDWNNWRQIFSWFIEYCLVEDEKFFSLPSNDSYIGQRRMRDELRHVWMLPEELVEETRQLPLEDDIPTMDS